MLKTPVVHIIGYKNSGKTRIAEGVIRRLHDLGYRTCFFKHIHDSSFSIDTPGKDSWRIAEAGAERVVLISEKERATIEREEFKQNNLEDILAQGEDFDLILIEGFKSIKPPKVDVSYIVTARNEEEISDLLRGRENILFINTPRSVEPEIAKGWQTGNILTNNESVVNFVDNTIVPLINAGRAWKKLPDLDCGKCGYESCREMANALAAKKDKDMGCVIGSEPSKLVIQVGEMKLVLKRFVQEIVRGSILAMVSTLKGSMISGDENVRVIIEKGE